jgi:hypothetical protein
VSGKLDRVATADPVAIEVWTRFNHPAGFAARIRGRSRVVVLDLESPTKHAGEFGRDGMQVLCQVYSSWLNQVELWFGKIQRDVIARGVFSSVADLARKLRKYIRAYAKSANPFRWTYTDPTRRVPAASDTK